VKRILIIAALLVGLFGAGSVAAAASTKHHGRHHSTSRSTSKPRQLRGPRGPRGPAGPAGPQGPQGVPGASQLANATTVTSSDSIGPNTIATFSTACPSGTRAIGGGASSSGTGGDNYIDYSYPSAIVNGIAQDWSALIENASSTTTYTVTIFAICA
jgi:hypothetical protein